MEINGNEEFELPIIITKGVVPFPTTSFVLSIERKSSIDTFEEIMNKFDGNCIIISQKDIDKANVESIEDIFVMGTFAYLDGKRKKKTGYWTNVNCLARVVISALRKENGINIATCSAILETDENPQDVAPKFEKILTRILTNPQKYLSSNDFDAKFKKKSQTGIDSSELTYYISRNLRITYDKKQALLEANDIDERLDLLIEDLDYIDESEKIETKINERLRDNTQKAQKEYILREKMRAISQEMGDDDNAYSNEILKKLNNNPYPKEVKTKIETELRKLKTMPSGTLEGALVKDYINNCLNLPWFEHTEDTKELKSVKKVLDEDHYGLFKVKDRILEYLAVKTINNNLKAPILCLYGPPGCGKTSLSISIARALNRKFVKASLGGVDDESQIRGHIRTYVGSRPGVIIRSLNKAKVNNPVFLLDEIDKLGKNGFRGDPSSALLEVLDPEQNTMFNDHYLEISFDLSNVLFICTANDLSNIPSALMDRLELIEVESYTLIEKMHIAKEYLIKKELVNTGLIDKNINFDDEALEYLIERYTREAGVRNLQRRIADCFRKAVVQYLNKEVSDGFVIAKEDVKKYLGLEDYDPTLKEKEKQIGVMTGLAYSSVGGSILPIEVNYFKGKGELILTGKIGDVMKESCQIAYSFVKANAKKLGIDEDIFEKISLHVHFPEGAIPKDGPSAGCAICCAIVSALTSKPISQDVAMTGEISLRGNSLAIGGLKEKTLAALRSGIKKVFVPKENKKNIVELPDEIQKNLEFIYMENVLDALNVIFDL